MAVNLPPLNIKKGPNLTYKGTPEQAIYYTTS